jgi:hypothetical protein
MSCPFCNYRLSLEQQAQSMMQAQALNSQYYSQVGLMNAAYLIGGTKPDRDGEEYLNSPLNRMLSVRKKK